jgi:hypothetical protein
MSGENIHKRTFKLGNTRVTTLLPESHPVYRGVMEAKELLGGEFPSHVASIRILPDTKTSSKIGEVVCGRCFFLQGVGQLLRFLLDLLPKLSMIF